MYANPFIYLEFISDVLMPMPGVTEGKAYGTCAFHVKKKMMARLKEDGEILVVYNEERERWISKDPSVYFVTNHYLNHPYVLVKLAKANPDDLEQLLMDAWSYRAPKKLVEDYQEAVLALC